MARFRKKPVVIEAWQSFNDAGEYTAMWPRWIMDALATKVLFDEGGVIKIKTLGGEITVSDGDWIIKDIKGELYPIKNDIFLETYEAAD